MKKVLSLFLLVSFVLILAGCDRATTVTTAATEEVSIIEATTIEIQGAPLDILNDFFNASDDFYGLGTTTYVTQDIKNYGNPFWDEEYEDNYLRFNATYDKTENSIELISSIKYDDNSGSYKEIKLYLYSGNINMRYVSYSDMDDSSNNFKEYRITYNLYLGERTCAADYDPDLPQYYSCENNLMIDSYIYAVYIDNFIDYVDYILYRAGLELIDFKFD